MPDGSFSVAELPAGFRVRGEPEISSGPAPGATSSVQFFVDEPARQQFSVSVHYGTPAVDQTRSSDNIFVEPSSRRVQDRDTYITTLSPALSKLDSLGVSWVIDATTVAYVFGTNMTLDELFSVADDAHAAPLDQVRR